MQMFSS